MNSLIEPRAAEKAAMASDVAILLNSILLSVANYWIGCWYLSERPSIYDFFLEVLIG